MKTPKSLLLISLALGTSSLLTACGGDDAGGNPIDAAAHDAAGDPPDSMPPTATRAGTIAVTEVALTSAQAGSHPGLEIMGGAVSIEFSDLTQNGGQVIFGTTTVGGCVVTKYDADHLPRPTVDAGPVTISAPETGDSGLLKPVGPCAYVAGIGYQCIGGGGIDQNASASAGAESINYVFTDQDITGQDLVGSYLSVSGFTNAAFNSGTSAFPIVRAQQQAGTGAIITVARRQEPAVASLQAGISFSILNGQGPVPTNVGFLVDADFLGDESTAIRIQKPVDADWPAIDYTVYTRGEAFDLSDASAQPHQFPFTAADVTFSCDGTGGNCGGNLTAVPTGTIQAFIVSGRTTDVVVDGLPDYYMPPSAAATEYTTFQCGFLVPDHTGTIPEAAVTAILSTSPTRIETRVLRVAGAILPDDLNQTFVLVGHGLVGHSTAP